MGGREEALTALWLKAMAGSVGFELSTMTKRADQL